MTSIGRISSIMKLGILPGGTEGIRGSSFFNHHAPWDDRSREILRSRIPTNDFPVVLYVPIAVLKSLGARLAESSYVVMFKELTWDHVRGAWYQLDPIDNTWKRMMAKGVTNHLITAAVHPDE